MVVQTQVDLFWDRVSGALHQHGVIDDTRRTPQRNLVVEILGATLQEGLAATRRQLISTLSLRADETSLDSLVAVKLEPRVLDARLDKAGGAVDALISEPWAASVGSEPGQSPPVGASFLFAAFQELSEEAFAMLLGCAIFLMQAGSRALAEGASADEVEAPQLGPRGRGRAQEPTWEVDAQLNRAIAKFSSTLVRKLIALAGSDGRDVERITASVWLRKANRVAREMRNGAIGGASRSDEPNVPG